MKIKMKSAADLARSVRKSPVPPGKTILSKKDKAKKNARRVFRQNRDDAESQ